MSEVEESKELQETEQGLKNLIDISGEIGYQVSALGLELQRLSRGYKQELERIKKRASKK